MKPAFIYFDLDNTLLDHSYAEQTAQRAIHQAYPALQQVPFDDWIAAYKEENGRLWEAYQQQEITRQELQYRRFRNPMTALGINAGNSDTIGDAYMLEYRRHWRWMEGAEPAFRAISKAYPVGIITNGFLETQQRKVEKMELHCATSHILITEELGVMKPHPKVFDVATERAQTDRSSILYVGDSYSSDVTGACRAGWQCAWFTGSDDTTGDYQPSFTFGAFPELLGWLRSKQA